MLEDKQKIIDFILKSNPSLWVKECMYYDLYTIRNELQIYTPNISEIYINIWIDKSWEKPFMSLFVIVTLLN